MCGIFAYIYPSGHTRHIPESLQESLQAIQHRGPDSTHCTVSVSPTTSVLLGFHRLAINGLTPSGMQPMSIDGLDMICNGEIYNFRELAQEHNIQLTTGSDCEILLHMIRTYGIDSTIRVLDGPFAFVLHDRIQRKVYVGRDPIGIRSLFIGIQGTEVYVASELKSLVGHVETITQFPPGTYQTFSYDSDSDAETGHPKLHRESVRYYKHEYSVSYVNTSLESTDPYLPMILHAVRTSFESAVKKRLISERPIGCLLSGGLDSSLVAALVAKQFPPKTLHTFSIGMAGSTDLVYARKVADHIQSIHHEYVVTIQDMLRAIPETIRQIESWDTTTVRASTPMYLLCQYIRRDTDMKVIFSGEGSDEASGSYLYFHRAPNPEAFHAECVRLLEDLSYFDVLRGDKCTAGCGLEIRVPFLDKKFLSVYMALDPRLKMPATFGIEKYILRKAFDDGSLLPSEVLWRVKEAFSDGVSGTQQSWYKMIQDHLLETAGFADPPRVSPEERVARESAYYQTLFESFYPGHATPHVIPYTWLPKWCGEQADPSARELAVYSEIASGDPREKRNTETDRISSDL